MSCHCSLHLPWRLPLVQVTCTTCTTAAYQLLSHPSTSIRLSFLIRETTTATTTTTTTTTTRPLSLFLQFNFTGHFLASISCLLLLLAFASEFSSPGVDLLPLPFLTSFRGVADGHVKKELAFPRVEPLHVEVVSVLSYFPSFLATGQAVRKPQQNSKKKEKEREYRSARNREV